MAGDREFEFGVPFPGSVLTRDRWTRTGLKDDGKPFDWERIFGRAVPHVVDLGCGNGRYLIGSALARPGVDHLGIDLVQPAVDYGAHRANKRGLSNVRFVKADAVEWLFRRLGEGSVDEIHVYHPQPYYEQTDASRRMLTPDFLDRAWRVLRPGGLLVLQTDNKSYWRYMLQAAAKHFEPEVLPGPWPDAPWGRTRREILARKKGLVVWRMVARRRETPRTGGIAPPDFDANRPRFLKKKAEKQPGP